MKALAAVVGVVVVGLGVLWATRGGERGSLRERAESPAAPQPVAPEIAPASVPVEGVEAERRALAVEPAAEAKPASEPPPAAAPGADELVVRARLVDPDGAPIVGGELARRRPEPPRVAESGADGEVALALERASLDRDRLQLEAHAPGRLRKTVQVEGELLQGASEHFLGEIVLAPGGSLAGRVVDERGAPVEGASVMARPPVEEPHPGERVMLPFSWFGDGVRVNGTSDADGRYRLEGVPCVEVEVLASDRRRLVARSAPCTVRAAEETAVPDLVLEEAEDADRIRGIVLAADGAPVAGVFVVLLSEDENGSYGGMPSGADGRFTILAPRERVYALRATNQETRASVKARDVRTGDPEVVLRFGERTELEIAVRDAVGTVEDFRAVVQDGDGRGLSGHTSHAPGLARVAVPAETFYVTVSTSSHVTQLVGPFEPASLPERVEVELERAGGISGVVLAGGVAVSGAEVHAHGALEDGAEIHHQAEGFATFVAPMVRASARTDEHGRFFLALRADGRFRVHATARGHGRATSAWLAYSDGTRIEGVELALPDAGAIEGRLLVAPEVDPRGRWIGAGNGEAHVVVTQTGADGTFRFDDLAPGRWQVRRLRPGQERNVISDRDSWPVEDADPPEWDVEVRAGATSSFDIDVRDEVPCRLAGRLTLGGTPARGTAWMMSELEDTHAVLDGEGRFVLRASKAGRFSIGVSTGDGDFSLVRDLAPGENTWERDVPVGTLLLENLPEVPPLDERYRSEMDWPEFSLSWSEGELSWQHDFQAGDARSARLEQVPAGKLVLRWRAEGEHPQDERNWPVRMELGVSAGAVEVVRVE